MKNKKILIVIAVSAIIVAGGVSYFVWKSGQPVTKSTNVGGNAPAAPSPEGESETPFVPDAITPGTPEQAAVAIKGYSFSPKSITVRRGTVVTWLNLDSAGHDIVSTGSLPDLKSPSFGYGERYSFTFDKTGTHEYFCGIHPSMKGTVVVTE